MGILHDRDGRLSLGRIMMVLVMFIACAFFTKAFFTWENLPDSIIPGLGTLATTLTIWIKATEVIGGKNVQP